MGKVSTMSYLRISRIFGVFPVSLSTNGAATFSLFTLPTFYSIASLLGHTAATSDFICSRLKQNQLLSYRLTVFPVAVVSVLTGSLICISSMLYSNDFFKLLTFMEQSELQNRGQFRTDYFNVVPILYFVCSLVQFTRYGLLFPESSSANTFLATGSEWDRVLALGISWLDFLRDGASLSALYFLIRFRKRVVLSFKRLCAEIAECCRCTMVPTYQGIIAVGSKVETQPLTGTELTERFVRHKAAFEIYTNIGGAFVFSLVTDIGAWLFYLLSAVLLNIEDSSTSFAFGMKIFQAGIIVMVLLTVAELGHQSASQVLVELA